MTGGFVDIEDRTYELFDERLTFPVMAEQIAREFGISTDEAFATMRKVHAERGTPSSARIREALAEVRRLIPQI
jgi:hypothetical protein